MTRPRALLVNEMGGGVEYAERLCLIARRLAAAGFHCRLALPRPLAAYYRQFFPTIAWPRLNSVAPFSAERAASYTDLLASVGFASPLDLTRMLSAADMRLAACAADLVIADFAPLAQLAARGRLPVVCLGSGYTMPPLACADLPPFRDDLEPMVEANELLAALSEALVARGASRPGSIAEAFAVRANVVYCHRELDIYAQYRLNSLAGPLPGGRPAALPAQPAIFGRLAPDHPDLDGILQCLVSAGVPSRIQVPNAPAALAATLAGTPVELSVGRCDLMPELNNCNLVLHAGDIDMADAALAAGRPQLLLPVYVEQALVADQLAELGIAVRIDRQWDAAAIVQTLRRAAANATLAALAQSLAVRLSQRHLKPALDLIVEQAVASVRQSD
ncbi:hypothetical protein A1507_14845 [Methylomonas koyamae]|uniref:Glycosyl transferase family 28 C-terminal domain-containing protein n=1 Tax=Methylomonas koyamae TaxID=702114 RepID=A0A177NC01_9GAMM|nr:hypothetical protein [Methylomonas koyamae]OAI14570.1 hypothetical protein A1507_14845 [Methylomonas koyamae]